MSSLVDSTLVSKSSLLKPLPIEYHIYSWPFGIVYSAWAYVIVNYYSAWFGSFEFAALSFILILALHALAYLVCQWSLTLKARLTCLKVLTLTLTIWRRLKI